MLTSECSRCLRTAHPGLQSGPWVQLHTSGIKTAEKMRQVWKIRRREGFQKCLCKPLQPKHLLYPKS
ncbi:hypothetical protein Q5P01_018758 [Channa striata]|uniref:Uncharacterized protein n=1 Tax=Channa striata TaxID=64152 RepID=A0AA88SA81_CHASR|nr:hypothetical protein Q5P01_018758 [Channa striata]